MAEQGTDLEALRREIHTLRSEVRKDVDGIRGDVRDLVAAWNTAKGVVKFVRLAGSIGAGIATLWAIFKISINLRGPN